MNFNTFCRPLAGLFFLLLLTVPGTAQSSQVHSHSGVFVPQDSLGVNYQDVLPGQTQHVLAYIYTGDLLTPGNLHFGIGMRGNALDVGAPQGRGVIFGTFDSGQCTGAAVEDFTRNRLFGNSQGIINGTCRPFNFKNFTTYQVEVWVTYHDVYYVFSERRFDPDLGRIDWVPVLSGGCMATAGTSCAQHPNDGNGGDAFVGSSVGPTDFHLDPLVWSTQFIVSHF